MRLRSVRRPYFARSCGVLCVLLTTHFLAFSCPHTHPPLNYTLYSHHCNANVFHFVLFSADLGQFTGNTTTWTVALPAYWTVQISIEDASLDEGWSQAVST